MKYYKILVLFLCSVWSQTIGTNAAEVKNDNPPVLNFFMKSRVSGEPGENMDDKLESIKISKDVRIMIVCTTKSVHMWDGKIDLGKFVVGMRAVQRSSTGNFSSVFWINLREMVIEDSSLPPSLNYLKCFELEKEQGRNLKCIYLNPIEEQKSKNLTNKGGQERVSISVNSCPQITTELENHSSQREISVPKDVPEWLWNAENNSVVCHVDSPSRIQLKSIYCENPSLCNINSFCTIHTCPSLVSIHTCQNDCSRHAMTVNYVAGQLKCKANGFSSSLNYVTDLNSEICYFNPGGSVSVCQVLDLQIPNNDVFHGLPLQLSGRASNFVIIQKPEVFIILSNGQVIKSSMILELDPKRRMSLRCSVVEFTKHQNLIATDVQIVSDFKYQRPNFIFTINVTANSSTRFIKIIGHRYGSTHPVIIRKRLNVKVGVPPEIIGLPTELHLLKTITVLPFRTMGHPIPEFELIFNGQIVAKTDGRFSLFVGQNKHTYLKIDTNTGAFSGVLKMSSKNFVGVHNHTISIQETLRLTRTEAYAVAVALAILLIFVPYYFFNALLKLCDTFRRRATAV